MKFLKETLVGLGAILLAGVGLILMAAGIAWLVRPSSFEGAGGGLQIAAIVGAILLALMAWGALTRK